MKIIWRTVFALLLVPATSAADSARSNAPIVAAGDDGTCYAKSVPADVLGQEGKTTVYSVRSGADLEVASYDWYSPGIFLSCRVWGETRPFVVVARRGEWPIGMHASSKDMSLAFYTEGRLLKEHSTLDIAGTANNVRRSVSHYSVFNEIDGFQMQDDGQIHFVLTRIDGIEVHISALTGQIVNQAH